LVDRCLSKPAANLDFSYWRVELWVTFRYCTKFPRPRGVAPDDAAFGPSSARAGGPVNHLGATLVDTQRITYAGAIVLEAIGTFFLVNTVMHAAVRGAAGRLAPFAIGMTVTVCILMFGAPTGGAVNPARTIGPAVATGLYDGVPIYLAAQFVGGPLAGLLYRVFWVRTEATTFKTHVLPAE
jgi:glycerol uptake facilitator-like aquaporin